MYKEEILECSQRRPIQLLSSDATRERDESREREKGLKMKS